MTRRWPGILWWAILAEQWRVLLLTAGVLVVVIAFAGSVKPMTDGKLDAADAIRFILLAVPPMLAYALPFAGGFAATMTYHRMTGDLETTAAAAGGIAHRTLLAPALASGVVIGAALFALNEQVIPRFLRSMEEVITQDVARLVTGAIERGKAVDVGGVSLYADRVERLRPTPESGASTWLMLTRVAALETDSQGRVARDVTASRAHLWLFPSNAAGRAGAAGESLVAMRLSGVVLTVPGEGLQNRSEDLELAWSIPGAFRDDPKFLTGPELVRLRREPDGMSWIDLRRRDLVHQIARADAGERLGLAFAREGRFTFRDRQGRPVVVAAAGAEWDGARWALRPAKGPASPGRGAVEVLADRSVPEGAPAESTSRDAARPRLRLLAQAAWIAPDMGPDRARRRMEFRLDLAGVSIADAAPPPASPGGDAPLPSPVIPGDDRAISGLTIEGLLPPERLDAGAWPSRRVLAEAADPLLARPDADAAAPGVRDAAAELRREIASLDREITSKQHERVALAITCGLMVLTGAVTAMIYRSRLPLTVYLLCFVPALVSIITIAGGQQMTHAMGGPGLFLLWGGVLLLAAYTFGAYARLARH